MTTDTEPGAITRTWTYAGRRHQTGGGLAYLWIDENGEERYFSKLRASSVGRRYQLDTNETGRSVYPASIRLLADEDRDDRAPQWDALDRAAYTAEQAAKTERRLAREQPMEDLTLAQCRSLIVNARAGQRTALIAQILRTIGA